MIKKLNLRRKDLCSPLDRTGLENIFGVIENLGKQDAMTLRRHLSVPLSLPFFGFGLAEVIASVTGCLFRFPSLKHGNEGFDPIRDRTGQLKFQKIAGVHIPGFGKSMF